MVRTRPLIKMLEELPIDLSLQFLVQVLEDDIAPCRWESIELRVGHRRAWSRLLAIQRLYEAGIDDALDSVAVSDLFAEQRSHQLFVECVRDGEMLEI